MGHEDRKLLPSLAPPLRYELQLSPHFDTSTFDGLVTITFQADEATNEVQLHSIDLEIHHVVFLFENKSQNIDYRTSNGVLILLLPQLVERQATFQITIKYTGIFKDNLIGLYQSTYEDDDGAKHLLAATHLEQGNARRVFPSIDEPDKKAKFIIAAIVQHGECCLSNMPEESRKYLKTGEDLVTFVESVPMSTYLVALVVGHLKSISSIGSRIPVTLYAPVGQESKGQHALEIAVKGLDLYEKIFDCPYPLPKLDLVAVPDFSSGAMENWGLILFRPVELLLEVSGSLSRRQRVTEVVLHEISHQWFGNLVTMKYWDSLWLNEGFATWMAKYASNLFYPQWHVWQDFVADTLQQALELDALRSSHPVEVIIKSAGDVGQVYDNIAYKKGCSILRMVAQRLGEQNFLEGVKLYLKRHRFGNTTTADLWMALGEASQQDVKAALSIWTEKTGFPVVAIEEMKKESKLSGIVLTQNRFLATGDTRPEENETPYPIHVSMRTSDGQTKSFNFNERELKLPIPDGGFYKINLDHTGFYRTAYPLQHLRQFGEPASRKLLSAEDKIGILADSVALAAAGLQQTSGILDLFRGMRSENEHLVWKQMVTGMKSITDAWRFQPAPITKGLKAFAADVFGAKALEIGWIVDNDDEEVLQLFKPLLLDAAGKAGFAPVINDILDRFRRYKEGDKIAIHPDIRDMAFGIALANGGDEVFDGVVTMYKASNNEEEKFNLLGNLGCVNTPALVSKALTLAFTDVVRNSELFLLIWCLNESPEGAKGLWVWATEHWEKIESGLTPDMLRTVVKLILAGFCTREQIAQVETFFQTRDRSQYDQVLAQELEKIQARSVWVTRDASNVESWLREHGYL